MCLYNKILMITCWNFVFVIGYKPLYFKQMFYFDGSIYTCNGSLLFNRTGLGQKKKLVLAFLIQADVNPIGTVMVGFLFALQHVTTLAFRTVFLTSSQLVLAAVACCRCEVWLLAVAGTSVLVQQPDS